MNIEITTAIIAFGGVLLGYLLHVLQKRWSRDDQRREWEREKTEELSGQYWEMTELVSKIYM